MANTATKLLGYGIFVVANGNVRVQAYLGEQGMVAWRDGARRFGSIAEANAEIARRGWLNQAAPVSVKTAAYACEIY